MTYWILLSTKLGSEFTLVSKVEGGRNAIVGFLKSGNLESANVIYAMEFGRSTSSKGSAPDTDLAHLLDDVAEDVLKVRGVGQSTFVLVALGQPRSPRSLREALQGIPTPT